MELRTAPFTTPQGQTAVSRMTWKNVTADALDWHWQRSTDGGATWAVRDWRTPPAIPFAATGRTRKLLLAAAVLLPVQVVLFQIGPLHDPTDIAAIGLTVGQWVLLNMAWAASRPAVEPREILAAEESIGRDAELRTAPDAATLS